ncbi:hypothetical protein DL770_006397 [Monosporascus sp. CRB-9-2]|nr:hypothetical protein DL770_006397 [Monosporascus sp. CRB-9-2]
MDGLETGPSGSDGRNTTESPPKTSLPLPGGMGNETQKPVDEDWIPTKHEKAIIYTLAFLNLIVSLDATIIVTSLTAIVDDIGGTTTEAFWIGTSYLLVNAVTMPMICSWYGVTLAAWALGLSLGPIMGGAIAERTTWRWIFYLMFPICGFGLVAVPYLLTLRPKKATAQEKMSRIDWLGGFTFTGSATAFLIAVSWGGTQHAWDSAATLAPLIIGLLGIVATVLYEAFLAKHPFLRKELFHDISSVTTYIAAALQGLMLYGTLYYCPLYFLAVKGYSPLDTGVALLPNLLTFAVSGSITGRLVTRFNNFRWAIWIGWLVGSVGPAMYIVWRVNDSKPIWVIAFILGGIGHGAILTAQNFAAQAMCKPGDEGAAAAMYIFSRQFGMAVGVGIGATTFQNVMRSRLAEDGLPTEIAEHAETYIPVLHSLPQGPQRDAIFDAYRFGLQIVYATWLAISVVTLFFCLVFIKHADMNRKLSSEHQLDSERMVRHWGRKEPQSDAEK